MEDITVLLGKIIISIDKINDDSIIFTLADNAQYQMYHSQDCCESVSIDDIVGNLDDLIGSPILQAEECTDADNPKRYSFDEDDGNSRVITDESSTWTFYKLATIKGYVTIRWYGSSNGYYSESVSFIKLR